MKQKRIIKNNRNKALGGIALASLISGILSLIGTGVSTAVSASNANKQAEELERQQKEQERAATAANNQQNSLQAQANIKDNFDNSNNIELETLKTGNISTLNTQTSAAKFGGKKRMCKLGSNVVSNYKNLTKYI